MNKLPVDIMCAIYEFVPVGALFSLMEWRRLIGDGSIKPRVVMRYHGKREMMAPNINEDLLSILSWINPIGGQNYGIAPATLSLLVSELKRGLEGVGDTAIGAAAAISMINATLRMLAKCDVSLEVQCAIRVAISGWLFRNIDSLVARLDECKALFEAPRTMFGIQYLTEYDSPRWSNEQMKGLPARYYEINDYESGVPDLARCPWPLAGVTTEQVKAYLYLSRPRHKGFDTIWPFIEELFLDHGKGSYSSYYGNDGPILNYFKMKWSNDGFDRIMMRGNGREVSNFAYLMLLLLRSKRKKEYLNEDVHEWHNISFSYLIEVLSTSIINLMLPWGHQDAFRDVMERKSPDENMNVYSFNEILKCHLFKTYVELNWRFNSDTSLVKNRAIFINAYHRSLANNCDLTNYVCFKVFRCL